ncbi:hypothetical protein J8L88_21930 [Aquimarina sp. MMG015]|uniref:hypothetical protein n=1 Tax=Aquimarina sp. MMG015 TaxID=2822689 RepID=UPI001B3A20C6|nr:hypothetical protein [Aquimarina sp. MMG015]MBQ4805538.1 hypothetical protein [Aquimarina sp. MMG015]
MKKEHQEIIDLISTYLEYDNDLRFGQAIFNLGINEFQKTTDPRNPNYNLRDIHNDNDADILKRIKRQLKWFDLQKRVMSGTSKLVGIEGMTVNERLYASDLMELFDEMKKTNKEYAQYILKSLKVDRESIEKILK